jgi:hypothetical protein
MIKKLEFNKGILMDSNRKTAIMAGILIIIGMVAGILSVVPSVESSDYLTEVSANKNQVLTGAFFQFTLFPIYIGFALILYPMIRKYNESLAIGFVSFRNYPLNILFVCDLSIFSSHNFIPIFHQNERLFCVYHEIQVAISDHFQEAYLAFQ